MEIIRLNGTEKQLYDMVAPLVMDPVVIRQNNGYPFKTSKDFVWYIAVGGGGIEGFVPLKRIAEGKLIDNYYVHEDNKETLGQLLEAIISEAGSGANLKATVQKRHVETFRKHGFETVIEWKKYDKMFYTGKKGQSDNEAT